MEPDDELQTIFDVTEIPKTRQAKVVAAGILSSDNLIAAKERLRSGDLEKELLNFANFLLDTILWAENFDKKHSRKPNFCIEFTEDAWKEFSEEQKRKGRQSLVNLYQARASASPNYQPPLEELQEVYESIAPELLRSDIDILENAITDVLKNSLGAFDYKSFVTRAAELNRKPGIPSSPTTFLVAGKTQAGKTSLKALLMTLCALQKESPLIIITKGVAESKELSGKLQAFVPSGAENIVCLSQVKGGFKKRKEIILVTLKCSGTIVIADTYHQIARVDEQLEIFGGKFMVIVDECDAMYRTHARSQKMEMAYDRLMAKNPCLSVMISATPIPLFLLLCDVDNDIPMFSLETKEEYMGIHDMKPLMVAGKAVRLKQNELKIGEGVPVQVTPEGSEGNEEMDDLASTSNSYDDFIPSTNEKVLRLYDDALCSDQKRRGVLVLDCTNPRVFAANNVKEKAERVQEKYLLEGKRIVVVINVGAGPSKKLPGENWLPYGNSTKIGEIIKIIDEEQGLEMPVFVFAFSKMKRGISYRSDQRVPTHFVLSLGRGHNAMNVIQAMGRATFNGKNILTQNGFGHVTLLSTATDFTMAQRALNFIDQVQRRVNEGEKLVDVIRGNLQEFKDTANFLRFTNRELGQLQGQRNELETLTTFETPAALNSQEEDIRKEYSENAEVQRVLRTMYDLACKNPGETFEMTDIQEAHNDTYQDKNYIAPRRLSQLLVELSDKSVIQKRGKDSRGHSPASYSVKYPRHLEKLITWLPYQDRPAYPDPDSGDDDEEESIMSHKDDFSNNVCPLRSRSRKRLGAYSNYTQKK